MSRISKLLIDLSTRLPHVGLPIFVGEYIIAPSVVGPAVKNGTVILVDERQDLVSGLGRHGEGYLHHTLHERSPRRSC